MPARRGVATSAPVLLERPAVSIENVQVGYGQPNGDLLVWRRVGFRHAGLSGSKPAGNPDLDGIWPGLSGLADRLQHGEVVDEPACDLEAELGVIDIGLQPDVADPAPGVVAEERAGFRFPAEFAAPRRLRRIEHGEDRTV